MSSGPIKEEDFKILMDVAKDAAEDRLISKFITESNLIEDIDDVEEDKLSFIAWRYLLRLKSDIQLDQLLEVHRLIIENQSPEIAGKLRDYDVTVGGRACLSHSQVRSHLSELLNKQPKTPLAALNWHVAFEKIHPFGDGNGRTGRLIYAWHCRRHGYNYLLFRNEDKRGYYGLFK